MTVDGLTRVGGYVVVALVWLTMAGCDAEECVQMRACCDQVEGRSEVGKACGELIEGVDDPGSCLGVTRSVVALLEEKGESVPKECQVSGSP